MTLVKIPYSKGNLELNLEESRLRGVLCSKAHEYKVEESQEEIVLKALQSPIGSEKLCRLASKAGKVLVITSDHTRPVPSKITLPLLLNEIRRENPGVEIKILIATGFHRLTTQAEMEDKFGETLVHSEEIINHNSRDKSSMVYKGILPSGGELWMNSLVDWADLVISEGFIEPHFFAGFSGGRKSILPGIASEKTVLANHCSKFIAHEYARTGNLEGNPIHKDMLFAAEAAKLGFILNVVIDGEKKVINAFAGDVEKAHLEGCSFVKKLASVEPVYADIVIASNGGYPLDQNIYQAVKGMTAAESCVRRGGVIILAASCCDGHGGEEFYKWFANSSGAGEVADKIASIPQEETIPDQWEAQILARVLLKCRVIMVTDMCSPKIITDMHMLHADTLDEALKMAEEITGKDSDIVVIPDGVGVIVG